MFLSQLKNLKNVFKKILILKKFLSSAQKCLHCMKFLLVYLVEFSKRQHLKTRHVNQMTRAYSMVVVLVSFISVALSENS